MPFTAFSAPSGSAVIERGAYASPSDSTPRPAGSRARPGARRHHDGLLEQFEQLEQQCRRHHSRHVPFRFAVRHRVVGTRQWAAATAAIKKNWETFFDGKSSVATKASLLEDGEKFTSVMESTAKAGANASATVQSVTITSPTEATVHYTVLLSGSPVLTGQKGTAVYQDGTWKVSTASFCGLAALESGGKAPAECS
jgi:hypothetical protein